MPTHFGRFTFAYANAGQTATLMLAGASPAEGFMLRLPPTLKAKATADGRALPRAANGDVPLPAGTKNVQIVFEAGD